MVRIEVAGDATGETRRADVDALRQALADSGIEHRELMLVRKSMDAGREALGVFELMNQVGRDWAPIIVAYLVGRRGRKVTVTVGDKSITAESKKEVEELLDVVDRLH
ncbi:hypothetical protein [Brevundimonas sp.]|uniref:hypothetical protein n=1 Tax=Brevundimonas sp. TaxID=1871086 RepID=UPI0035ADDA50